MKRKILFLLIAIFVLCTVIPVYAEDTNSNYEEVDVYAKYVRLEHGVPVINIYNGKGMATMDDGTTICVSGVPREAVAFVVYAIPEQEEDAWIWFKKCINDVGVLLQPYDIYFLDQYGNRLNVNQVNITIKQDDINKSHVIYGVTTKGKISKIDSKYSSSMLSFFANGSHYYTIVKNIEKTDTPVISEQEKNEGVPNTISINLIQFWEKFLLFSLIIFAIFCFNRWKRLMKKDI